MVLRASIFLLSMAIGAAHASGQASPIADNQTATLTCLPQETGFPRQQLFIKSIDGKRAGTWSSGLRKSVILSPGQHTISIKYVFVVMSRQVIFDLNVKPGHTYHCIGKDEGKDIFHITIQDQDTGESIDPVGFTCTQFGNRCT